MAGTPATPAGSQRSSRRMRSTTIEAPRPLCAGPPRSAPHAEAVLAAFPDLRFELVRAVATLDSPGRYDGAAITGARTAARARLARRIGTAGLGATNPGRPEQGVGSRRAAGVGRTHGASGCRWPATCSPRDASRTELSATLGKCRPALGLGGGRCRRSAEIAPGARELRDSRPKRPQSASIGRVQARIGATVAVARM